VPQRTAGQDAAEAERNRNWDPNSPLYGKNPAKPGTSASGVVAASAAPVAPATLPAPPATPPVATAAPTATPPAAREPAALPADKPASAARTGAPITAASGTDPFTYFVQAGAFGRTEDAEQQRAKLAMLGMEARTTEREQSGKTVYRVRVGPFDRKSDADSAKDKLAAAGVEAALVRVQR